LAIPVSDGSSSDVSGGSDVGESLRLALLIGSVIPAGNVLVAWFSKSVVAKEIILHWDAHDQYVS
jgi:hypothetical protein